MSYETLDNQLDAPDNGEWTVGEIESAIDDLIYEVECNSRAWDEQNDYKIDMCSDILSVNFGKEDSDEKMSLIRSIISEYVYKWAKATVELDPDSYCVRYKFDDADWQREYA